MDHLVRSEIQLSPEVIEHAEDTAAYFLEGYIRYPLAFIIGKKAAWEAFNDLGPSAREFFMGLGMDEEDLPWMTDWGDFESYMSHHADQIAKKLVIDYSKDV